MYKFTVLILTLLLCFALLPAQTAEELQDMGRNVSNNYMERSPYTSAAVTSPNATEALWDLQFSFNLEVASGALGNAGAEFDGTYYYTARWASNLIHKYDMSGNLVEEFSIPGVSGLRDLAFDGTYFYGGAALTTIYQMDFVTKTLIGTITAPQNVRNIAYDPSADGFWVGDWATPIVLINRSGATLASLTTGLIAQYGSAYDDWTPGGPYLWIFNQDATTGGSPQYIHQFDLNTMTATGVVHDVWQDFPASGATAIAGGLFTAEGIVPGKASIGGVLQGVPDMFFVYELADAGDPLDPNPPTNFVAFSDEMTPTSMLLTWDDPTTYVNGNPLTNFTIEIERDGVFLTSVSSGTETYTDMGLTQYTEYIYDIYAKDNLDSTSSPVSATWMAGGYVPVMVVEPTAIGDTMLIGGVSVHTMTIYNNH
jgi:hypothetical protein